MDCSMVYSTIAQQCGNASTCALCVCVYMCVYVCICVYLCVFVCICVYMCVYVCICTYICTCICVDMCIYVYTYVPLPGRCVYVYIFVYVCIYACVYICVHMCTCVHMCIHTCLHLGVEGVTNSLNSSLHIPRRSLQRVRVLHFLKSQCPSTVTIERHCRGYF